jgi:hypothetical protein
VQRRQHQFAHRILERLAGHLLDDEAGDAPGPEFVKYLKHLPRRKTRSVSLRLATVAASPGSLASK